MKLVIATTNQGKIREMKNAFSGLAVEVLALADFSIEGEPVENGATFEENAKIKAEFYAEKTGLPCLADDSGLEVAILGNAPGVHSARYAGVHGDDEANNQKLVEELQRMGMYRAQARYRCALHLAFPDGTALTADGSCIGEVRTGARGMGGFGYDPHFYVGQLSMAELSLEAKQKISHRGNALRALRKKMEERYENWAGK